MTAQELVSRAGNGPFRVSLGNGVIGFTGNCFYAEVEVFYSRRLIPTTNGVDCFDLADEANAMLAGHV